MRALGFESSKEEILQILKENDRLKQGTINKDDFFRVSKYICLLVC